MKYAYWGGSIGNYINSLLQDNFRLYYEDIKHHLEESLYLIIANGNVEFTFNWPKKRIEIDASIRILYNYCGYRGGFRINIYFDKDNNGNPDLLFKIKTICEYFLKYSGKSKNIIKKLLSECNSFEKVNIIMNELGIYSTMTEGVILLLLLAPILQKQK